MALFDWLKTRAAGVLLHPTCLPGPTGIGGFGVAAYRFVDYLAQAGAKYWQVLPLGPTSYGDSPYQSFSAFAGNPYLIDLHALIPLGLLTTDDLKPLENLGTTKVDYGAQYFLRYGVLQKAYERFKAAKCFEEYGSFDKFQKTHESWLKPYGLYMAFKAAHEGKGWDHWSADLRRYESAVRTPQAKAAADTARAYEFWQYLFWGQWQRLKGYANGRGVQIIGDMPIFVALDSADLWANPELFQLDAEGNPTHIAGVPPDYFSATGQRWGNPLYDWQLHTKTGYRWWLKRLSHAFALYDIVRIDHFRGFYDYWQIPASCPSAVTGQWQPGPALDLFQTVAGRYPNAQLIAEDLGDLHEGVRQFLTETGLPGMSILQFAFGGDSGNAYLPHNAKENQIAYTGTHDNDTTQGWFENAPEHVRAHVQQYLNCTPADMLDRAINALFESVSRVAIVPVQDLLALNSSARINTPGTAMGNWDWRMSAEQLEQLDPRKLRAMLQMYGRSQ